MARAKTASIEVKISLPMQFSLKFDNVFRMVLEIVRTDAKFAHKTLVDHLWNSRKLNFAGLLLPSRITQLSLRTQDQLLMIIHPLVANLPPMFIVDIATVEDEDDYLALDAPIKFSGPDEMIVVRKALFGSKKAYASVRKELLAWFEQEDVWLAHRGWLDDLLIQAEKAAKKKPDALAGVPRVLKERAQKLASVGVAFKVERRDTGYCLVVED